MDFEHGQHEGPNGRVFRKTAVAPTMFGEAFVEKGSGFDVRVQHESDRALLEQGLSTMPVVNRARSPRTMDFLDAMNFASLGGN
jgi:hypothetical protein